MSYVSEAAELVRSLNSNDVVLSSNDYVIISEWEKQEFPLDLVLETIREYFDDEGEHNQKSLAEIKQELRVKYAAWLTSIASISRQERCEDV